MISHTLNLINSETLAQNWHSEPGKNVSGHEIPPRIILKQRSPHTACSMPCPPHRRYTPFADVKVLEEASPVMACVCVTMEPAAFLNRSM